jgi:hypothetical protein
MPDHVSGPETPGFSPGSGFIQKLGNYKDIIRCKQYSDTLSL